MNDCQIALARSFFQLRGECPVNLLKKRENANSLLKWSVEEISLELIPLFIKSKQRFNVYRSINFFGVIPVSVVKFLVKATRERLYNAARSSTEVCTLT